VYRDNDDWADRLFIGGIALGVAAAVTYWFCSVMLAPLWSGSILEDELQREDLWRR
jgi:hypothetical protein